MPPLIKIYEDIVAKPYADTGGDEGETIAITGVENENFPSLKIWILESLRAREVLYSYYIKSHHMNVFITML